jgi:flagellar protein FliS
MNSEFQADSAGSPSLAERGRLLLALYEGALGFLERAAVAYGRQDFEHFAYFLGRAQNVIGELDSTLDYKQGHELATMLSRLYEFMIFQLTEARRTRNIELVCEETNRLRQIYDSYRQVIAGLEDPGTASATDPGAGLDADSGGWGTRTETVLEER